MDSAPQVDADVTEEASRACHFCSEAMALEAVLCTSCGRFSKPPEKDRPNLPLGTFFDAANQRLAEWERGFPRSTEVLDRLSRIDARVSDRIRFFTAGVCLCIAVSYMIIWSRPYGGYDMGRGALAALVTAGTLIALPRLMRRRAVAEAAPPGSPVLRLFGEETNFVAAQAIAACLALAYAVTLEFSSTKFWSWVALGLTLPCFFSRARTWTLFVGAGVICLLVYLSSFSLGDLLTLDIEKRRYWTPLLIPVEPFVFFAVSVALFPQISTISFGRFGIGRFMGDFNLQTPFGRVDIALGSTVILISAWVTIWSLIYTPNWLPVLLFGLNPELRSLIESAGQ